MKTGRMLLEEIINMKPFIDKYIENMNEDTDETEESEESEESENVEEEKKPSKIQNAFESFMKRNSMELVEFESEDLQDGIQINFKVSMREDADKCQKLLNKGVNGISKFKDISIDESEEKDGFWIKALMVKKSDNSDKSVYEEVYSIVRIGDPSVESLVDAGEMELIDLQLKESIRKAKKGLLKEAQSSLERVLHILNNPSGKYSSESIKLIRGLAQLKNGIAKMKPEKASLKLVDIYEKIKENYEEIEDALWGNIE